MKLYLFLLILGLSWFIRAQNTTASPGNATATAANATTTAANATNTTAANATNTTATNATAAAGNTTAVVTNATSTNATNATVPVVVTGETEVPWTEEANFIDQEALRNFLNENDLVTNPVLADSLDYGVEFLDVWGAEEGYLETGQEYVLDSLNVIQNQQGNETLAFYDVTLKDVTNSSSKNVSFFVGVFFNSTDNNRTINLSYVIDPLYVSPDGGNFLYQNWTKSYTWPEFNGNTDNSQSIFFFGLNTVIGRAAAQGILANTHYFVSRLFGAASSTPSSAAGQTSEQYFIYDAELSTPSHGNVEVIFTVKVQQNTQQVDRWILFET